MAEDLRAEIKAAIHARLQVAPGWVAFFLEVASAGHDPNRFRRPGW